MDKVLKNCFVDKYIIVNSIIMAGFALFSVYYGFFLHPNPTWDNYLTWIFEIISLVSFAVSYVLFYKKKYSLFYYYILIPLTVFFLYLLATTSFYYSIPIFGVLNMVMLTFASRASARFKKHFIPITIGFMILISILQTSGIIPIISGLDNPTLPSKIANIVLLVFMIITMFIAFKSVYVAGCSKGAAVDIFQSKLNVKNFAIERYSLSDSEAETLHHLLLDLTPTLIFKKTTSQKQIKAMSSNAIATKKKNIGRKISRLREKLKIDKHQDVYEELSARYSKSEPAPNPELEMV